MTALSTDLTLVQMESIEQEIERDRHSFLRMGNNLIRIREGKGYKLRGFKTFEDYCDRRWGISDRHGRRLIEAAETAEKTRVVLGAAPSSESVARELKKVADDPVVLQKVADRLEKKKVTVNTATAEQVADVVATVIGKPRPEPKAAASPSGNGHKPASGVSALPVAATDECPQCRRVPNSYKHGANGWQCGNCGQLVRLNVTIVMALTFTPAKPKPCRNCGQELKSGVSLCFNCGEPVR